MKVGIISLYGWLKLWDNYGTIMQNYALQEFLRRNGHETFWIRTRNSAEAINSSAPVYVRLLTLLRRFAGFLLRPLRGKPKSIRLAEFAAAHPRHFGAFMERYVPTTVAEYTVEDLQNSPPDAEAYVVGSDQIWKYATPMNFLNFGSANARRVAYAVSAPWPLLNDSWYAQARTLVQRLDAVAVRETDGLPVCRKLGRDDAVQVIDPTLLLEERDYLALAHQCEPATNDSPPDVLGYFVNLGTLREIPWPSIHGFAQSRRATLKVVPLQGSELVIPLEYIFTPSPTGWIKAYHSAKYVVTNSFHGALFAVIMRKPFLVFLQTGATEAENCRFYSALAPLGLTDRIIPATQWTRSSEVNLAVWIDRPIDWDLVHGLLSKLRQSSTDYLVGALANC